MEKWRGEVELRGKDGQKLSKHSRGRGINEKRKKYSKRIDWEQWINGQGYLIVREGLIVGWSSGLDSRSIKQVDSIDTTGGRDQGVLRIC